MRKPGIILLLLYLSTFTEMHQLMRLPVLFAHYQEHQSITVGISFLDYIVQHYLDESQPDHRHEDLPFKHRHCEILHLVVAVVPNITPSSFTPFSPGDIPLVSYEPQLHLTSVSASIWQPPRHQRA